MISAQAIIELRNLHYTWPGQNSPCLVIETLTIHTGERIFLHGPSGSGKSTLLGMLGAVHTPQAGELRVLGESLPTLPATQRDRFRADHIGFIFQLFNLVPYLSVIDNVILPTHFSERRRKLATPERATVEAEATRLLTRLHIDQHLWQRPVTTLSVGQQQRVAAARALIGQPEILIADEPTSALDAALQEDFLTLLMHECATAGSTLICVSHDQRLAASFDRSIDLATLNHAATRASHSV